MGARVTGAPILAIVLASTSAVASAQFTQVPTRSGRRPACLTPRLIGEPRCGGERFGSGMELDSDAWRVVASSGIAGMHRFVPAGQSRRGEPLFRQDGVGQALTADEWLQGRRGVLFFDSMPDGAPTGRVTLRMARDRPLEGLLFFHATELRLRTPPASPRRVDRPGEPFLDVGIDLDHDGSVCDASGPGACCPDRPATPREITRCNELGTIDNCRWDVELDEGCDPDAAPCSSDGAGSDAPWPPDHPAWTSFVRSHDGSGEGDPRTTSRPHEPFLDAGGSTGWDRMDVSEQPLSLHGHAYNTGSIVVARRFAALGAIMALEDVRLPSKPRLMRGDCPARFPAPSWPAGARPEPCP